MRKDKLKKLTFVKSAPSKYAINVPTGVLVLMITTAFLRFSSLKHLLKTVESTAHKNDSENPFKSHRYLSEKKGGRKNTAIFIPAETRSEKVMINLALYFLQSIPFIICPAP